MATQAQIEANRRNARKSTGPRTPEGKAMSSRNSLLHGLTAQKLLLPEENLGELEILREEFLGEWNPDTPTERELVERMVMASWRLRRFASVEAGLLSLALQNEPIPPELAETGAVGPVAWAFRSACRGKDEFNKLARYEAHLQRDFSNCMKELQKMRAQRVAGASAGALMRMSALHGKTKPNPTPGTLPPTAAPIRPDPESCKSNPNSAGHNPAPCPPSSAPQRPPRVGRNEPCPCGSGKKYKRCCLNADTLPCPGSTLFPAGAAKAMAA